MVTLKLSRWQPVFATMAIHNRILLIYIYNTTPAANDVLHQYIYIIIRYIHSKHILLMHPDSQKTEIRKAETCGSTLFHSPVRTRGNPKIFAPNHLPQTPPPHTTCGREDRAVRNTTPGRSDSRGAGYASPLRPLDFWPPPRGRTAPAVDRLGSVKAWAERRRGTK